MTPDIRPLEIPTGLPPDARASELIRIWYAGDRQYVSIRSDAWDDPAAWGVILADLVRHVSHSVALSSGRDAKGVEARLIEGFNAERASPT
jgi:hypothetical protein